MAEGNIQLYKKTHLIFTATLIQNLKKETSLKKIRKIVECHPHHAIMKIDVQVTLISI